MTRPATPPPATVRPELLVFLDEIKGRPHDDTPRLVLADWLQEYGGPAESARGELLRVQVLRHQLLPGDPRLPALRRREGELLRQHLDAWAGPLVEHFVWRFERGLLHLEARAEKLLSPEVAALLTPDLCLWVESLAVGGMSLGGQMTRIASSPLLLHLHTLDLAGNKLQAEAILALVRSGDLRRLRSLLLAGNRVGPAGAATIAATPQLAGLTLLDLGGNRIGDEGAFALARSPHLSELAELRLGSNRITEEGRAALRARFGDRVSF
jgi:uncharacterized protein (TIGR02996 family)